MKATRLSVALGLVFALLEPSLPASAAPVPYSDPAAVGTITLCDTTGHVATHGDIHVKPFIWRAVGSAAAPAPYNAAGRTAGLYGYQPIQYVDPTQWNGDYLTASATYTSADHPMAAATAADPSLADLLSSYPPRWDGLIELRMFLGVPGAPTHTTPYNAATIRVTGDSWTLLDGGSSGCDSGTARSAELILPKVRKLPTPAPDATTDVPTKPSAGSKTGSATPPRRGSGSPKNGSTGRSTGHRTSAPRGTAGASVQTPKSSSATSSSATSSKSSSGSSFTPWAIGIIIAACVAGAALAWRRHGPARNR